MQPTEDAEGKNILIIATSGPSTPHRCATPFYLASVLTSMEHAVNMFFTMEGVKLMERGIPEHFSAMPGGQNIMGFIRAAKMAGVNMYVCKAALPGYGVSEDRLLPEINGIASAGDLARMITSCDQLLSL
ncbi:sulfur reduction protein DsrE [Acidithiobacillus ferrivorans]|nr:sulfur reduction protein DsrE [Acidithiobacillus ferrivorans]